jgi:hypothetical protein
MVAEKILHINFLSNIQRYKLSGIFHRSLEVASTNVVLQTVTIVTITY